MIILLDFQKCFPLSNQPFRAHHFRKDQATSHPSDQLAEGIIRNPRQGGQKKGGVKLKIAESHHHSKMEKWNVGRMFFTHLPIIPAFQYFQLSLRFVPVFLDRLDCLVNTKGVSKIEPFLF